jgi:phosphodiesterase/alkaline phosphatase D-like protein
MRTTIALALACAGLALLPSVAPAQTVTFNSISLTWTAPGDDSLTGTASQYDLRYSTSAITSSNFASATRWTNMPTPAASGTTQGVVVTGLTANTTYYFALKTADEVPNWSGISNVISRTTLAAPDLIRPAPIATVTITGTTENTASLRWTAVGDDSLTGTATSYDVRYSTSPITESNWGSASQVSGEPVPTAAGTTQNMTVNGLTRQTTYYFAMKAADDAGNSSALSNVVSATTPDQTTPAAVRDLAVGFLGFRWIAGSPAIESASRVATLRPRGCGGR